jgi:hypothetical protein
MGGVGAIPAPMWIEMFRADEMRLERVGCHVRISE